MQKPGNPPAKLAAVQFAILGPVEARTNGSALQLGGPKPRALLAMLLLDANEPVSRDRLIEGLWGDDPPPSADQTLDSYVSRLRRMLGPDRVVRRPPGYMLVVEPGELDLERFERLVEGRSLHEALGLWRGPALADVLYEPFASEEAERLEERRLVALEERIEADLAAGEGARLVPELEALDAGASVPRAPDRPAHARALPRRPPGRRARRHARGAAAARRRARAGAGPAAARARAADPRPGPAARRAPSRPPRPRPARAPPAPARAGRARARRRGRRRRAARGRRRLAGARRRARGPTARSRSTRAAAARPPPPSSRHRDRRGRRGRVAVARRPRGPARPAARPGQRRRSRTGSRCPASRAA